jgi:hypothetical protein
MTTLTHEEISEMFPSIGRQIEEGRCIVQNAMPKTVVKNVNPTESFPEKMKRESTEFVANCDRIRQKNNAAIPTGQRPIATGAPKQKTLDQVYREIGNAWKTSTEAELLPQTDPSVHLAAAFGGKRPKPKAGAEVFAKLSNAWKR